MEYRIHLYKQTKAQGRNRSKFNIQNAREYIFFVFLMKKFIYYLWPLQAHPLSSSVFANVCYCLLQDHFVLYLSQATPSLCPLDRSMLLGHAGKEPSPFRSTLWLLCLPQEPLSANFPTAAVAGSPSSVLHVLLLGFGEEVRFGRKQCR